jgi:hypothetical protein
MSEADGNQISRVEPPLLNDELDSLNSWLDYHRATLLQKCEGLTGDELTQASVPPSGLTLLGLLQHMAGVEWWWFDHIFWASETPDPFDAGGDAAYEFTHIDPADANANSLSTFIARGWASRTPTSCRS